MNTAVIQATPALQAQLMTAYEPYKAPSKNAYIAAYFKLAKVTISVYTSGKVVFQGEKAEQEASRWGYQVECPAPTETIRQDLALLGTDEVGNGSYFGGLAVVASLVTPADHAFLQELGVDDSKKMNDHTIRKIAPILQEKIPHQALLLSPKKYNEVIEQGYNAVSVKVALHNQAIFLLLKKGAKADKIVIDAFTSKKNYDRYLTKEKNQVTQVVHLEEKAEGKYLAVAVSSIIARSLFLDNLKQLSQEIGHQLPSGAGHQSDLIASRILKEQGLAGLGHTAKLHFANTQKAHALVNGGKPWNNFWRNGADLPYF